jgi:LysR family transcriptional regulator, regulator for metE and metH
MIERSHLQIISALDELGTLTQAAEALCLSQSALSHQIRKLEELAGVRIWHRVGRSLYLTPAGKC